MNRSILAAVLLGALVVLAGCSGGGNTADDNNGPGDGTDNGAVNFFEFDDTGRYVYDVKIDGESGQVVWDIEAVSGDQITVYVDYDVGSDSYESTVTGTKTDIQNQLLYSPAGSFVMLGMFSPMFGYYDGEELYVGKEWSYTAPDRSGSMSFEVVGTQSYAGVECYASELRVDGGLVHEACFSPDLGLAANTVWHDDTTGETTMRMELVEYDQN